jgi:histidine ammonia-lyase
LDTSAALRYDSVAAMLVLDGESLTLEAVEAVAARGERVAIAGDSLARMTRSRAVVERMTEADAPPVYAVNTGVGLLADTRIPAADIAQLQRNLILSHCCGVGDPLPGAVVRAMMLIRANVLAKGLSGVRPAVAERICDLLNRGVTPVAPSRGSVGASGDLAPLAHMAAVLIGEGEAVIEGTRLSGAAALGRVGVEPLELAAKEAVALINGTQAMLAIGSLELLATERLAGNADVVCALSLDALHGTPRAFEAALHEARPHPGQVAVARRLAELIEGSEIRASHAGCRRVQDAYSVRCAPQVHGAVREALAEARRVFSIELNSATDNPLVLGEEIVSGGNFHGEILALQFDYLAIALTALAGISERRIERMVNPALSEGLPPFLAKNPGLESGFMMAQVTAASLVGELRVLAAPASTGSITTDGNKEDFVSMGMTAALKFAEAVRLARTVAAIEALAAVRALQFLRPLKTSPALEPVRGEIESLIGPIEGDRALGGCIAQVEEWLRGRAL